jgi:peptidyl-prolyl cis-trans isomerase SurA
MIEQTLRLAEAQRIGIRISDKQVNDAYARFASSNNMPLAQLDSVMAQSGVTKQHFKDFIRSQMAWNQAIGARYRAEQSGSGLTSQQEAVRNMLKKGGNKPSATEYMLQQVIFVIPPAERKSTMGKRKREAEALRARFNGCANTQQFAKGLIDVTVRDLGRIIAPQLPPEWADQIKKTKAGGATGVRETERGVEFIGVCSAREVSDDRVAELVLQNENSDADADKLGQKYMEELKKTAKIVRR